jgi:DHA2 family multidrug resistance protein-like MFS transporter
VLGGLVLEHFWWGAAFLVGVPVMVVLLVLGPMLLPEFRDPTPRPFDVVSAALSLVAVLAVIFGMKQIVQDGLSWLPASSIVAGVVVGAVFLHRQQTSVDPLIDLRLFGVPAFSASLATNTLSIFGGIGALLFIAQYLQLVIGLSPLQAGLWTLPSSAALIIGSMLAPVIARRVCPTLVVAGGLVLMALGFGIFTQVHGGSALAVLVLGDVVLSLGVAPVVTLGTDLIVGAAPPEQAGSASAISETGSELGGALGIAILGTIGTAVYRSQMTGVLLSGIPAEVADTARGTLGGAVAVAERLPDPVRAELLRTARDAFAQALDLTAALTLVGLLAMAIALVLFQRVPASSASEECAMNHGPAQAIAIS